MFFELRQYRIKKGKRPEWVRLMDEKIIPFQKRMGMTVIGSFISRDDEDLYIWIRRFESEAEKNRLYDKVYGSAYWQQTIRKAMGDMLLKNESAVVILEATNASDLK